MKRVLIKVLFAVLPMAGCLPAGAQEHNSDTLAKLIRTRNFVFRAQWVIAFTGIRRQLIPTYELQMTSDSIVCYLPFFGRMYTVPTPEDLRFMSIHFTSRKYSYDARPQKRRGWTITAVPQDARDVQQLLFSVARGGWATLTIRSAGRDQISYEGVVEAP